MNTIDSTAIDISQLSIEPFTQRPFIELIKESNEKNLSHVIAKVFLKNESVPVIYDARLLCKYLFELVISKDGRMVRLKRVSDPMNDKVIRDILFYEVAGPGKEESGSYIGNQKDFLQSTGFRSRIFNRNDPFDSLSINFMFKDKESNKVGKKPVLIIGVSFTVLCIILVSCTYTIIKT
ncbi:hypothetical protein NEMIN01_1697 [Nematocida minor]|uniref:uncharacterized protein n=1 Tax=Nematocida minor TaxID=1912983 RepID=UPI00221FFC26|nr:uncharacterized protein NEMIN01_1697 [Nematocida minor]KAI5191842.1 hypothetical protein NEMIN01_1697 [Nematocida minor]